MGWHCPCPRIGSAQGLPRHNAGSVRHCSFGFWRASPGFEACRLRDGTLQYAKVGFPARAGRATMAACNTPLTPI